MRPRTEGQAGGCRCEELCSTVKSVEMAGLFDYD